MDPNDPARDAAPSAPSELDIIRTERDLLAHQLAEERRRLRLRRDRYDTAIDRRDRQLEHERRRVANRDTVIAAARTELGLPLVAQLVSVVRLLRRVTGRVRRTIQIRRASPVIESAGPRSLNAADFRAASAAAIDRGMPTVAVVRMEGAGQATADTDRRSQVVAQGMAELGWRVTTVRLGPDDPPWDPALAVIIVVTPGVSRRRLPATAAIVARVEERLPEWIVGGLDDYDLILTDTEATAKAVAKATSLRPVVVGSGQLGPGLREALRTWVDAPKIAIHIPPTTWEAAATWGDTAFARGLQRAFAGCGWAATVLVSSEAEDARAIRADVALHVAGVATPAVHPGQPAILWVISHPDRVRASTCALYELIFVASEVFAQELADRVDRPVLSLAQATDPERFFPERTGPRHELLFVGNSRGVRRPVLDSLVRAGRDVAVYGGNWTPELIDPAVVRGAWIPNEDLHRYYASADVVLSDHWEDMRAEGFISNRVYDALASGAFVVSDRVVGMNSTFDGAVAEYGDDTELVAAIDWALANPDERRERADRGRAAVLSRHTFHHRVRAIIDALAEAAVWPRRP